MGMFDEIDETEAVAGDDKNRLFQTHKKSSEISRRYLKLLGGFAVIVLIVGVVIGYMTLPRMGDIVRAPKGLEEAVREHFLLKEKRTSTDITFHHCETYYWARVGVEKRPDIKTNPLYLIDSYKARAVAQPDGGWAITAEPITSPDLDVPCG